MLPFESNSHPDGIKKAKRVRKTPSDATVCPLWIYKFDASTPNDISSL